MYLSQTYLLSPVLVSRESNINWQADYSINEKYDCIKNDSWAVGSILQKYLYSPMNVIYKIIEIIRSEW